jgi:hypothetical protein
MVLHYSFVCREYQIGVDVHRGRFQYQQTRVVTFVAHYQLENRTQYKLAYLQRHQLQNQVSPVMKHLAQECWHVYPSRAPNKIDCM